MITKHLILIITLLLVAGCGTDMLDTDTLSPEALTDSEGAEASIEITEPALWMTTTYTDVNTGQTFTLDQFKGTPVLAESFAVWCPTCTRQQRNTKALHEELGDSFISVSLDTDPNEDAQLIKDHTEANRFDWRYAISPKEATLSLIDEFGIGVVNAPAAPVILICPDQSRRLLGRGLKSVDELKEAIGSC